MFWSLMTTRLDLAFKVVEAFIKMLQTIVEILI